MKYISLLPLAFLLSLLTACRKDEVSIIPIEIQKDLDASTYASVSGFFLLNEGNMGSNKSSLDFYDIRNGAYFRNIYPTQNPTIVKELGDVGNDIGIYGSKLYAVINASHYIEVMDTRNAKHLGSIKVNNVRYITFHRGCAYASSYAGPIKIDPTARPGKVVEIDTLSYKITREVTVGYQPEEMVVYQGKLYVANSGGYRVPKYDTTISVIDLESFKVERTIEVAPNLHRMEIDKRGRIYVSSRGDYKDIPSDVYVIDATQGKKIHKIGKAASTMCLIGDSLYMVASEWNMEKQKNTTSYSIYDIKKEMIVSDNFITDGTDKKIKVPYGITIHPETKDIFIPDAGNYVTPGTLYCFSPEGKLKSMITTGDIPAHFAWSTIDFELKN